MSAYNAYWLKGGPLGIVPQSISTGHPRYWLKGAPFQPLLSATVVIPPDPVPNNHRPTAKRLATGEDDWRFMGQKRMSPYWVGGTIAAIPRRAAQIIG